ncbi:hypothetical protein ACIBQ0_17045 [Nocardia nova]|uniref:hypothetical protein n=1 Tax=Nocardia nova TaxID=37330 RepID=UPI0037B6B7D0
MIVVGIDPSLTSTGVAISGTPVQVARIQSKGTENDTWQQRFDRISAVAHQIAADIPNGSLTVIEAPSYGSVGGAKHDRVGLWWFTYRLLEAKGCRIIPVAPSQRSKYATGSGRAHKDHVLAAAVKRYPDIDITGNDVADAVILMAMGCRLAGRPIDNVPATHLAALDKLEAIEEAADA